VAVTDVAVIVADNINLPRRKAEKFSFAVFFYPADLRKKQIEGKNAPLNGLEVEKIAKRAILNRNILHKYFKQFCRSL
jgi:hypothetical protein